MKYQSNPEMEKLKNKMMAMKVAPKEVAGEEEIDPSKNMKTNLLKKKIQLLAIPMEEKAQDYEEDMPTEGYDQSNQAKIITEQSRIAREKKLRQMIESMK